MTIKYEPEGDWIIGRALVPKVSRTIVLPNGAHGVSRHYLIDSCGSKASDLGYKPGDMVVAKFVYDMHLVRGHRVVFQPSEVISRVREYDLADFNNYPDNTPADGSKESPIVGAAS